jgi:hypothetical protein
MRIGLMATIGLTMVATTSALGAVISGDRSADAGFQIETQSDIRNLPSEIPPTKLTIAFSAQ